MLRASLLGALSLRSWKFVGGSLAVRLSETAASPQSDRSRLTCAVILSTPGAMSELLKPAAMDQPGCGGNFESVRGPNTYGQSDSHNSSPLKNS